MACNRTGVLGYFGVGRDSEDGTLCLTRTKPEGPAGIELAVTPAVKAIPEGDNGWLIVKHDLSAKGDQAGGTYPPLPQFLKIEVYKSEGGREFFTILEGKRKGKTASVRCIYTDERGVRLCG